MTYAARYRLCLSLLLTLALALPYTTLAQADDGSPSATPSPETSRLLFVPDPLAGGGGVVTGQVIDGTHDKAAPTGTVVKLYARGLDGTPLGAISTTVSTGGAFRFEGIDPSGRAQLEARASYQGLAYPTGGMEAFKLSPQSPQAHVQITVYETTTQAGAIRIEQLHIAFNLTAERLQVAERYTLSNDGDRTYVGTTSGGTLALTRPANAANFQPGGDASRYLTSSHGITDTQPVPPGARTAYASLIYDLPYNPDQALVLRRPLLYPTTRVIIFVPQGALQLNGDGLQTGEPFEAQGVTFETYRVTGLAAGDELTLRLSGGPNAPAPGSNGPSLIIGLLILGSAVGLSYLYWQGDLDRRPVFEPSSRQQALLQAIADLDDAQALGKVPGDTYQLRRAQLKQELLIMMGQERPS